ncbi:MAG: phosphatase PAP2 family protein [Pseudolabrys sp.]|jgi:membrane-associated phospholipid phosphatase
MSAIQRWLTTLALVTLVVIGCYLWLDRPLALLAHSVLPAHRRGLSEPLTHIPDPLIPAAALAFVGLGFRALGRRPLSWLAETVVICSVSVAMGQVIKNQLKFVFGRTWPDTWIGNNPSFIHDHVYGFNLFHGGGYASFPSGHMIATCALIAVLWIRYPQLKPLYALTALAVAVDLVGANFHFLSDVIAGAFVGATTGWLAMVLFDRFGAGRPYGS